MSVLIKGMEMPRNCWECQFSSEYPVVDGIALGCLITMKTKEKDLKPVPDWCPLIELPPHGRLIDADALIEDLERQCKEVFRIDAVSPDDYWITRNEAYNEALWETWVESFDNYLKTRQTVIPADKDGET